MRSIRNPALPATTSAAPAQGSLRIRRSSFFPITFLISVALAFTTPAPAAEQPHTFSTQGDHFILDGKPFKVISGELHYARIPRQYWHARLKMARAMGLNTVATYVFWNVHEPAPGQYNFTGNADLAAFIRAAEQEGLYVILRSGPYACAEWDLGGLPAWLLKPTEAPPTAVISTRAKRGGETPVSPDARAISNPPFPLRSTDARFLVPADRWIHRLGQEVASLQVGHGGPILMTQIENEYGNFGPVPGDPPKGYMAHLRQTFLDAGFTASLLYSADNWRNIPRGDLPGLLAATNFGIGNHQGGMDALERERPGEPLFVSEYWPGWFDHWGHPHETRPVAPQLEDVDYILHRGAGINIYMFHGGTSFGFMAGSSWTDNHFLPDVTSYDYDAPLDESGRPTAKFFAYRKLLAQFTCPAAKNAVSLSEAQKPPRASLPTAPGQPAATCLPPVPATPPTITVPAITFTHSTTLWANLPPPISTLTPGPMEAFNQEYGYILYRKELPKPVAGELAISGLHDFAVIFLDGQRIGTLDRRSDVLGADRHPVPQTLQLQTSGPARLDILVADDGRINSTGMMRSERKGITGAVTLAGQPLTGWQNFPLPMSAVAAQFTPDRHAVGSLPGIPVFRHAAFNLTRTGDTFLDITHLGKGALWINGHPIGRFWNVGPEQTLYIPGPWLRKGRNEIVVFDLKPPLSPAVVSGLDHAVLNGPAADEARSKQE